MLSDVILKHAWSITDGASGIFANFLEEWVRYVALKLERLKCNELSFD